MKKYLPIFIIVLLFIATGCSKSDTNDPEPEYDYSNSYLPLNPGDTWTYIHNDKDTITTMVDNNSFTQDQQTFFEVKSNNTDGLFYSKDDKKYYVFIHTDNDLGQGFVIPILDASESDGYSVTTKDSISNSNNPTPDLSTMTILNDNFSMTINGKTYNQVVHTTVDVEEAFNGYYMNTQTYDFYFSQGIGLIEIDKSNAGHIYDKLTIISYKLN